MPKTIANAVYEKIRLDIINGALKPGQKISEEMLSDRYKASRTPIREALSLLSSDGLVIHTPHSGTAVKYFDMAEATRIFDVRIFLEGCAAKLAAEQHHPTDRLDPMIQLNEEIKALYKTNDPNNTPRINQMEQEFHREIGILSDNHYLLDYIERNQRVHAVLLNYGIHHRVDEGMGIPFSEMLNSHDQIIAGITRNEPTVAEWAARMHVMEAKQFYLSSIIKEQGQEP